MPKPSKTLYENQQAVRNRVIAAIRDIIGLPQVEHAYLWGSLATEQFGVYERPWSDHAGVTHIGSDIDLVLVLADDQQPPGTYTGVEREWCRIHELKTVEIAGNPHHVEGLVVKPGHEKQMMAAIREDAQLLK